MRALSAIFAQYPDVKNSGVEFESSAGGFYLVNSEGAEVREPEDILWCVCEPARKRPTA